MVRVGWLPETQASPLIHYHHRVFCRRYTRGSKRERRSLDTSPETVRLSSSTRSSLLKLYTQFLRDRRLYYSVERRWPESLFWQTRREP